MESLESTNNYPTKYTVKISRIPLEIFFRFLQENQYRTLIRIVNERLHIEKVLPTSAGGGSDQVKKKKLNGCLFNALIERNKDQDRG